MFKMLLFRGGMCGDLIGELLDPSIINDRGRIKDSHAKLKKFSTMNSADKNQFVRDNMQSDIVLLSHDTDLAYLYKSNVTQIICSDLDKIIIFAERFYRLHSPHVIEEASKYLNAHCDFVSEYASSLITWQNYHSGFKRFDIKNLGSDIFLQDFANFFNVEVTQTMSNTYQTWRSKNLEFNF